MTFKKTFAFFILLALLVLPNASSAEGFEEPKVEYSADSYFETEGMSMKSRVYHSPGKERRDMEGMVMIVRQDKKVVWQLMPNMKKYMEHTIDKADKKTEDLSDYKVEQTVIGPDTIEGLKATKYKVVMTGKKGNRQTGLMWATKDGIMVRLETEGEYDGKKMKMKNYLRNVKIARQDPKLFEIPAGYAPMGSVMDMFKGAQEDARKAQEDAGRKAKEAEAKRAKEKEARKKKANEERDYTASERDYTSGERDYTSAPRQKTSTSTGAAPSSTDAAKDTAKKLWKLFGK